MNILLITATYIPSVNGVAISVSELKNSLEKLGHNVFLFAPNNKMANVEKEKNVFRYPSIETTLLKDYPIPLVVTIPFVKKALGKIVPDIVHVHHPFHVGYAAQQIAKYYQIPLVFTYHTNYDLYADKYLDFLPKQVKTFFVENNINDFCKSTDLIISPSKYIKTKLLTKHSFLNVSCVPTGVHIVGKSKLSSTKIVLIDRFKNKKVLLYVGRLTREKNISTLITTLKYLDDRFVLHLVGDGIEKNKIKEKVKTLNLDTRIVIEGRVAHSKLDKYYKSADIFVMPSTSETQGLVFLEAMSFGLPIVAVESAAAKEWVKDGIGFISKNNPGEFAKSINKTAQTLSAPLVKSISKSQLYTPDITAKKISKEYKKIKERMSFALKLTEWGWQSWSTGEKQTVFSLRRDFNPTNLEIVPSEVFNNYTYVNKKPVKGWCSWYCMGSSITYQKIISQVNSIKTKKLQLEYVLIDEGWTRWGDWNKHIEKKFPGGMNKLSQEIKSMGFKPGIWIAPFLVERNSEIYKKHPDWVVKRNRMPINGINWTIFDGFYLERFLLDVRIKAVQKYILRSIDTLLKNDGFNLIKLDFLYAIYFIPKITSKEAGSFIRNIFKYIKSTYPSVYTIACGSPFTPLVGVVDSVRIGPDTISPYLNIPIVKSIFHNRRVNQVIKNIEKRKWTIKYWNIDPDVFVCRKSVGLTRTKILELQKAVKECKGNIFLGDDILCLEDWRIREFILPLLNDHD